MHPGKYPGVLRPSGDQINSGGLYTAVTQYIGQLYHIPANLIERPGKQVAQIMGKKLAGGYPGFFAQALHLCPNLPPR